MPSQDAKDSLSDPTNHALPATPSDPACPPFDELTAWLERRASGTSLQPAPAFAAHVQKCPRCMHLIALAEAAETEGGIDAGFADHDPSAIPPGLRTPVSSAGKGPRAGKYKGKFSAATWRLLTGESELRRKP